MDQALLSGTRQDRGLALSRDKRLKPIAGSKWYVPSQSQASGGYVVDVAEGSCTCPDHETRACKCKHLYAVEFTMRATVTAPDGSEIEVSKTVRVTYGQDWTNYNAAQTHEREHVSALLKALCEGIVNPPHAGRGRPRLPLSDLVYASTMKVYTGFSARRAASDVRDCASKGFIDAPMHYNSIHNLIERPDVRPLLVTLVEESAAPLKAIESTFAIDSTGFSSSTYSRWYDEKYGRERKRHDWITLHAMVGVKSGAITAARVTGTDEGDAPQLPGLVANTAKRFDLAEVTADKAYLSNKNLEAIEAVGAVPFIPFKSNSKGLGPAAWRRMWGLFTYKRDWFLDRYHARSNVEAVFSSMKRKFGASVRARLPEAQKNELLLKALCNNLSCVVHGMYELGVEPDFWTQPEVQ